MPISILDLVNKVAIKAGVAKDNPDFVAILTNPELSKVTIPDDLVAKIESGLHTLDSAKSVLKSQLEGTIKAEIYNGLDAELYKLAMDNGLDDAAIAELKADQKTSARIAKLTTTIKALEAKKASAASGDKAELVEKINKLTLEQGNLVKTHTEAIAAEQAKANSKINDFAINSHMMGYEYGGTTPKNVQAITARTLLNQRLAELQAIAFYDEKTGQIKAQKQDGTMLIDKANNELTFQSIADSVLAENKMLKTSDPSQGNGGNGGGNNSIPGGGTTNNQAHLNMVDTLLKEVQTTT